MADELSSIIRYVVRKNLFPQLLDDGRSASASLSNSGSVVLSARGGGRQSARDRRRLVQRCRALKGDISKYEAEFKAQHGHEPKQQERAPMQSIYEEYRNIKQVIRDSAALQIQCVFRGHRARRKVAASKQADGSASRPAVVVPAPAASKFEPTASDGSSRPTITVSTPAPDLIVKLNALRDEKAGLKRKLRQFDIDFAASHSGRAPTKQEKEHLRPQYTRYHELKGLISNLEDATGKKRSGGDADSPPGSALNSAGSSRSITTGAITPASVVTPGGPDTSASMVVGAGASASGAKRLPSSTSASPASTSLPSASATPSSTAAATAHVVSASSSTAASAVLHADAASNRGRSDSAASAGLGGMGLGDDEADDDHGPGHNGASSARPGGALDAAAVDRLNALKAEKKKLQSTLREYERDFASRNGRPVKYVKDIAPVMERYQRYKQLKAMMKEITG